MKILFSVYHDLNTEARSLGILQCLEKMGVVDLVSLGEAKRKNISGTHINIRGRSKYYYVWFLIATIRLILIKPYQIIVLHDNYTAILLMFLSFYKKKTFVVYDSSELYVTPNNYQSFINKIIDNILQKIERKFIKRANLIFAANEERARIMRRYYHLKTMPSVLPNTHRIEDMYDKMICQQKYDKYFDDRSVNFVYGGGLSTSRPIYELIDAFHRLGNAYRLIIAGNASREALLRFKKYIADRQIKNVSYVGFIPRSEWRYLIVKSHATISVFYQDRLNDKYCASGKFYEGIFEGKPILASANPPFKRICNTKLVGISTDDLQKGCIYIHEHYEELRHNVSRYISEINIQNIYASFINTILEEYQHHKLLRRYE